MKNILFIGCMLFGIFSVRSVSAAGKRNSQVVYYTKMPTLSVKEMEEQCIKGINEIRQQHGLHPLKHWLQLSDCAREHSQNMSSNKYPMGHDGFDDRHDKMNKKATIYTFAENVAYNQGYDNPVHKVIEGWMKSKGHKKNILNPVFEETGLGISINKEGTIFYTQLFAARYN